MHRKAFETFLQGIYERRETLIMNGKKQIETCGGCPEMKSCEKVGAIIGNNPDARDRLEIAGSV